MAIFSAIGAAVAAISGWVGGLGAFGAFALKTAVGIGLSYAAQALAGKPKSEEQKFSINTGLSGGGALSRSFIMGRAATGGSLVWANTWGKSDGASNAWLTQVIAISDIPVRGLVELFVDGNKVTYDPAKDGETVFGQSIPEYEKGGANLYVKFYDGNQTAADPALIANATTADRVWNSTRIGRGVAYAVIHARSSKGVFSGIPAFTFVVDGIKLYDVSKDSTAGGDGPQRWSQPETWGGDGDDLPAVQTYNLLRGIYYGNRWVYGLQGVSAARLPAQNWIRQIEKCRKPIITTTVPEPTYRSGGEVIVNAALSVALSELMQTCQGKVSEAGGIYTMYLGEPDEALFSFTDGDIVSTEEQSFTPFYGIADSVNGITATYPDPADGYVEKAAPPIYRPDLEVLDGNRRMLASVQYTFVPYAEQVQRLMKAQLLASLRYRRHTLTLPPKFWRFAVPGETLRWTSERNGYVNKLFVIDGVVDKANLDVTIDITEFEPSDYAWDSGTEYTPPTSGALGPIVPSPRPIVDPFVEPYTLVDNERGSRRPAIRLVWDAAEETLIGVAGVEWEVRLLGTTEVVLNGNTTFPERGATIISAGIIPNTQYEVRMRYVPDQGAPENLFSGWLVVTTPNVLLGASDIEFDLGEVLEDASHLWIRLGQQLDDVWKRLEHLALAEQLQGAVGQVSRQEILAEVGQARASITQEIDVRATETAALAARATRIDARVADNAAKILVEELARADGDEALAFQVTALRAEIGNGFAEGMIEFRAVAAPAGVTARYAMLLRASLDDAFLESGMYVEIYTDTGGILRSRFGVLAQQFVVSNGIDGFLPMVFENGELKLQIANIGSVRTADINLGNGKVVINENGIVVRSA